MFIMSVVLLPESKSVVIPVDDKYCLGLSCRFGDIFVFCYTHAQECEKDENSRALRNLNSRESSDGVQFASEEKVLAT